MKKEVSKRPQKVSIPFLDTYLYFGRDQHSNIFFYFDRLYRALGNMAGEGIGMDGAHIIDDNYIKVFKSLKTQRYVKDGDFLARLIYVEDMKKLKEDGFNDVGRVKYLKKWLRKNLPDIYDYYEGRDIIHSIAA